MMCGGLGETREASTEVQEIIDAVKAAVEEKLDQKFDTFVLKQFKTQVVAGTNYFAKVHIGDDKCLHIRVYKDLKGNISLSAVQSDKKHEDPIAYF